jgi:methylmalonyl-CoA mutase
LQHETGIPKVVDPLAGSYFVERLTHELALAARSVIDEVDAVGGMARAIELRLPQQRIARAAAERQARVDRGQDLVVGVNAFHAPSEPELELLAVDGSGVRAAQSARLTAVRRQRDGGRVSALLEALETGARGTANLLELTIEAMRARATVGEVSQALERAFGRHDEVTMATTGVFSKAYEGDTAWEAAAEAVRQFAEREGRQPRILVAKLGQDGHDRGAKVVAAGLSDLGFDVELGPLFQTPEQAARQALENDVHFVGVSTQAGAHLTLVPELLDALSRLGAERVRVVAGGIISAADRQLLEARGVASVFGPGTPVLGIARTLLELLGEQAARSSE